jgi:hypothetical protein
MAKKRVQYSIEYGFKAKAELLYSYISIPYNLSVWFADKVDVENEVFHFYWKDSVESAKIFKQAFKKKVVFHWVDRKGEEYLTFQIDTDELTINTVLVVTDWDDEDQIEQARMMWDVAIDKLKKLVGG